MLIWEPALYGSAAHLIREIARWRGLGWTGIVLPGAVYGVFEEGLVITSWFNPFHYAPYFPKVYKPGEGANSHVAVLTRSAQDAEPSST